MYQEHSIFPCEFDFLKYCLLLLISLFQFVFVFEQCRPHKIKDKNEIDRMTLSTNIQLPDCMSAEMKTLLEGLLQRDVDKRLGCTGNG